MHILYSINGILIFRTRMLSKLPAKFRDVFNNLELYLQNILFSISFFLIVHHFQRNSVPVRACLGISMKNKKLSVN